MVYIFFSIHLIKRYLNCNFYCISKLRQKGLSMKRKKSAFAFLPQLREHVIYLNSTYSESEVSTNGRIQKRNYESVE